MCPLLQSILLLVNNMLSLAFDPEAFGGAEAFARDVTQLMDWTKASPPIAHGGTVLLPGEIENRTRHERQSIGLPIDEETWKGIVWAAQTVGVEVPSL